MPVSDYHSDSFVGHDDIVDELIRRAFSTPLRGRSLLIEGPANRGKSWLLCRIHEKLGNRDTLTAIVPECPPVVSCLFSSENASPFEPLRLVSSVWASLHRLQPKSFWLPQVAPDPNGADVVAALVEFFTREGSDAQNLLSIIKQKLDESDPAVRLILLVDGLDEFESLDSLERQFLEPLFRTANAYLIASRRSQVNTARWSTFSLRSETKDAPLSLARLSQEAAEQQINRYFEHKESPLQFADLRPLFQHYLWQNPGANRRFADNAIASRAIGARNLITRDDIYRCLLDLSCSSHFADPISKEDFAWLNAVVHEIPQIGSREVPTHILNDILSGVARRLIGDRERNEWLGRLQDRGMVVRQMNGQCLIHEEFAALCQEWEARRTA